LCIYIALACSALDVHLVPRRPGVDFGQLEGHDMSPHVASSDHIYMHRARSIYGGRRGINGLVHFLDDEILVLLPCQNATESRQCLVNVSGPEILRTSKGQNHTLISSVITCINPGVTPVKSIPSM